MLFCVFCSPKSSTVVLACFCRVLCDFPLSHFGHPPNMVTCVRPGPKLKAVAVWYIRGCARSGRVSWGEIWSRWYWLTSLLEANVNMYYKLSQLKQSLIHHHSPPSTSQSWHPGSIDPAECCPRYLVPQWPAAGGAPLHSWDNRQHERIFLLGVGLPQVSPVWSIPGTSDTAHTHTHDECYNGTYNIIFGFHN